MVVCGVVRFDHPAADRLVKLLPKVIAVDAWSSPEVEWIQSTLRLMAIEARERRPGGETVITRLADILVIQAIRSWIASDPAAQTGWLGALQDKQIGHAIALVHREPARPWTIESLANEVAMSRSAFAARFTEQVGEPVMHYVARWRMHVALTWLKEEGTAVSEMASRLGYESEAAFSRAFKRFLGFSPGGGSADEVSTPLCSCRADLVGGPPRSLSLETRRQGRTGEFPERIFADPPCRRILRFRQAPRHPDGSRIEREIAFADRAQGHPDQTPVRHAGLPESPPVERGTFQPAELCPEFRQPG